MDYGTYDPKDLITYDDTIVMCVKGDNVWLEMRMYRAVFDEWASSGQPISRTIGVPSGTRESASRTRIGLMLDPLDVIRFQRAAMTFAEKLDSPIKSSDIPAVLDAGLAAMGLDQASRAKVTGVSNFPRRARACLVAALKAGKRRRRFDSHDKFVGLKFVGYFPKAVLIRQEQRTEVRATKTVNSDPRPLLAVPSAAGVPLPTAIDRFIEQNDRALDEKKKQDKDVDWKQNREKHLHSSLPRISCFAFRGDDRAPDEMHSRNGFLPGVTRKDAGVAGLDTMVIGDKDTKKVSVAGIVAELKEVLKRPAGSSSTRDATETQQQYFEVLRDYALLHLGNYTADQRFRGFISASKSIAIAKHFADESAKTTDTSWCYAVHCRSGYELPSHLPPPGAANGVPTVILKDLHDFANHFEQEVAVAGAIWWDQVVGFREVERNTAGGQVFRGPVYLREPEFWTGEQKAFGAMFELMSGRSQGDAPTKIFPSYVPKPNTTDPWDLIRN